MTQLRSGLILADAAIALALDMEARGHVLTADSGLLKVSNGAALTAEDRAGIVRWRWHLLAIVGGETWTASASEAHDSCTDHESLKPSLSAALDSQSDASKSSQATSSTATSSSSTTRSAPRTSRAKKASPAAFAWETEAAR